MPNKTGKRKENMAKEEKKLTGDPRIDSNWFSRDHQTSEAHMQAHRTREERDRKKFFGPEERAKARTNRTPQEQLAVLDARLGKGIGAKKERAILTKMIAAK